MNSVIRETGDYSLNSQPRKNTKEDVSNRNYSGISGSGLLSMFCSNLRNAKYNCLSLIAYCSSRLMRNDISILTTLRKNLSFVAFSPQVDKRVMSKSKRNYLYQMLELTRCTKILYWTIYHDFLISSFTKERNICSVSTYSLHIADTFSVFSSSSNSSWIYSRKENN
jgi:hypothetical protein